MSVRREFQIDIPVLNGVKFIFKENIGMWSITYEENSGLTLKYLLSCPVFIDSGIYDYT